MLCVWFSPWQHQNEANPLVPLIKEIQSQFEATLTTESRWYKKTKKAMGTLNRRGGLAGAKLLEHVADAKLLEHVADAAMSLFMQRPANVARGVTDAMRQGWQDAEPDLTPVSDGQRFHLLFEDAIDEVLTGIREQFAKTPTSDEITKNARLIVFVDDLDRCEEEVIVRLLEAIKLYLSSRRCVFVLGLDDGAVLDALGRYWKRSVDSNREYLEKLFQAIVAVPLPAVADVRRSVAAQLKQHGIPFDEDLASDIDQLIEPNPRKIKNFTNGLCSAWRLHAAARWVESPDDVRRFLMFHYLRLYHRPIWRLLERQPESLRLFWRTLKKGAAATEGLGLEHLDERDQRLLEEVFSRAFAHVLPHTADPVAEAIMGQANDKGRRHRNQDIEDAVKSFIERQDRKRSDEYFVRMFNELEVAPRNLPDTYLYLPEGI